MQNIEELNYLITSNRIGELIHASEMFHEKQLIDIANEIVREQSRIHIVLIAGPTCSGKTTFLKRLCVQLRADGLQPVGLSTDNYYLERENVPKGKKGHPDFESIEAIDLPFFNQHLLALENGVEIATPRFIFGVGKRAPQSEWRKIRLGSKDILIVEGMHCLNDRLTSQISREQKFKIYLNALSQLVMDIANSIHTTDLRLLRRIVRDRLYRGYSAEETLQMWPQVIKSEERNIFPFQKSADRMFNTALPYELAVLKLHAERFLLDVLEDHPKDYEVHRLMKFLSLIVGISPDKVPLNSFLREFIGGSVFQC